MKGYRTTIIGVLITVLGTAEQFNWIDLVPTEWANLIIAAIGVIMIYLRKITTTPIGDSTTS